MQFLILQIHIMMPFQHSHGDYYYVSADAERVRQFAGHPYKQRHQRKEKRRCDNTDYSFGFVIQYLPFIRAACPAEPLKHQAESIGRHTKLLISRRSDHLLNEVHIKPPDRFHLISLQSQ